MTPDERARYVAQARARITMQVEAHGHPLDDETLALLLEIEALRASVRQLSSYDQSGDFIVQMPGRMGGTPTLGHSRMPAEQVAFAVWDGDVAEYEGLDWDYSRRQVLIACWWFVRTYAESRRKKLRAVADAWADWYDAAFPLLWAKGDELPPLPPTRDEVRA